MIYRTVLARHNNAANMIEMLIACKCNFSLECSNYTMRIKLLHDTNYKFIKNKQGNQVFAAKRMIEADIKNVNVKNIEAEQVSYFSHNFRQPIYVERVVNIDLKSAYINILFFDGIISEKTHKYLRGLRKMERLAAVGMLASRKEIFTYDKGKIIDRVEERNPNAKFFYYAVQRTFEMMKELEKICGKDYLFTWVDGIYFLPRPGLKEECEKYLNEIKFPFSTDYLNEFEVKYMKGTINVTFKKDGDLRVFNLPMPDNQFKKAMQAMLFNERKVKTFSIHTKILKNKNTKNEKGNNLSAAKRR